MLAQIKSVAYNSDLSETEKLAAYEDWFAMPEKGADSTS
eukprot:SAG11_NODE_8817_length_973_cov_1.813501_1_plen_38_part_10